MNIRFSYEDWERIVHDWDLFLAGELKRPLVWIQVWNPLHKPVLERKGFLPQYPSSMSPNQIIEIETKYLNGFHFVGDAFPKLFLNFGAGSSAVYFGSKPNVKNDTIWFEPIHKELQDIHIDLNRDNDWFHRIQAIQQAALDLWKGQVLISLSDIGGNLDILASLRGTQELLMDFLEYPECVEKLSRQITSVWLEIYNEEAENVLGVCRGTTPWASVFSPRKTYMLQSDISYMISPKMFEQFVLPDLTTCCNFLDDGFYHLDGKGQIPHLDLLLSINKLKGVQWIPGDGQPEPQYWHHVLSKIRNAGKLCQLYVSPQGALQIKNEFGGEGFIFHIVTWEEPWTLNDAVDLYHQLTRS